MTDPARKSDTEATASATPAVGSSAGEASNLVAAFGSALLKSAEAKTRDTAAPNVRAAFALGWHMSELESLQPSSKGLPGMSGLSKPQRRELAMNQVRAGLTALKDPIADAGLDAIEPPA